MYKVCKKLEEYCVANSIPYTEVQQKKELLQEDLLRPTSCDYDRGERVIDVFAHGDIALRILALTTPLETSEIVLQVWDFEEDCWQSRRAYGVGPALDAFDDARRLSPAPHEEDVLAEWAWVQNESTAPTHLHQNPVLFASWWYETRAIDWLAIGDNGRYEDTHPWPVLRDVAETIFWRNGFLDSHWNAAYAERIKEQIALFPVHGKNW